MSLHGKENSYFNIESPKFFTPPHESTTVSKAILIDAQARDDRYVKLAKPLPKN